jgi:hypothetical protein
MTILHPSSVVIPACHVPDLGFPMTTIENNFIHEEIFVDDFKKGEQLIVTNTKTEERHAVGVMNQNQMEQDKQPWIGVVQVKFTLDS